MDRARKLGRFSRFIVFMVSLYHGATVGRPSPCRFYPTCSNYCVEAVQCHGALGGTYLTIARLLRCRPFGPKGVDLVPERVFKRRRI